MHRASTALICGDFGHQRCSNFHGRTHRASISSISRNFVHWGCRNYFNGWTQRVFINLRTSGTRECPLHVHGWKHRASTLLSRIPRILGTRGVRSAPTGGRTGRLKTNPRTSDTRSVQPTSTDGRTGRLFNEFPRFSGTRGVQSTPKS